MPGESLYDVFVSLKLDGFDRVAKELENTESNASSAEGSIWG